MTRHNPCVWLVWHTVKQEWWLPGCRGTTVYTDAAGRFTRDQAEQIRNGMTEPGDPRERLGRIVRAPEAGDQLDAFPEYRPIHSEFGVDPHSWNVGDDGADHGVGLDLFSSALQVWQILQNRDISVRDAAIAFRCTDGMIREAVDAHPWMFLEGPDDDPTKQIIQDEGE